MERYKSYAVLVVLSHIAVVSSGVDFTLQQHQYTTCSGTVSLTSPVTLTLSDFYYYAISDESWLVAYSETTDGQGVSIGLFLMPYPLMTYEGAAVSVELPVGNTWFDFAAVGIWSSTYSFDLCSFVIPTDLVLASSRMRKPLTLRRLLIKLGIRMLGLLYLYSSGVAMRW